MGLRSLAFELRILTRAPSLRSVALRVLVSPVLTVTLALPAVAWASPEGEGASPEGTDATGTVVTEAGADGDGAAPTAADSIEAPPNESGDEASSSSESEPSEDPISEAKRWWLRGQELADVGEYFQAANAWIESYEHHPTEDALINAARAYQLSDHPLAALETFLRYTDAYGEGGKFAREAKAAVPRLKAKVGTIASQQIPEHRRPAEVIINAESRPLEEFPIFVEPGRIAVVLVADDGRRIAQDIQYLEAGSTLVMDFAVPDPIDQAATGSPSARAINYPRNRALRASFYTGFTLTILAGGGVAVFGALTRSARDEYDANNCGGACPEGTADGDQAERMLEAKRVLPIYRGTTNILIGVTALFGVTTAILGAVSFTGERKPLRPHLESHAGALRLVF
jgi:hypothetical protein